MVTRPMTRRVVIAALALLMIPGELRAQAPIFRTDSAEVDGRRIHYRIGGAGPTLLLLHGFAGAGAWWAPFLERLAEDYTTIVPDLPGHGHSEGQPGPYRFDRAAKDMHELMELLGIARFRAAGYSGGGITLIHMATQEPDRIEAMALLATPQLTRDAITGFPPFGDHSARVRSYWLEIHRGGETQVRRLIASFHALADLTEEVSVPRERLSRIEARTLIVTGDRDPRVPLNVALEMYEAIPNAALWVVPMEGHSAVWADWGGSPEAASIFPAVLRRFLGSAPPAGSPGEPGDGRQ